jgi:hypothetical protein
MLAHIFRSGEPKRVRIEDITLGAPVLLAEAPVPENLPSAGFRRSRFELRAAALKSGGSGASGGSGGGATARKTPSVPKLTGADLRNAEPEGAAIDRKITKLQDEIAKSHEALATHDQGDFTGLGELTALASRLANEVATLEARWLELSEQVEASR